MVTALIANLEKLIGGPRDNALLRFSLGNEYLKLGNHEQAVKHLKQALVFDERYSAAWKLLGQALANGEDLSAALAVYRQGIAVAEQKGDKQAAKEMHVFARRIEKALNDKLNDK